jgi:hypothetical protein
MIYGGMESKFADVPDPFWALVRPLCRQSHRR